MLVGGKTEKKHDRRPQATLEDILTCYRCSAVFCRAGGEIKHNGNAIKQITPSPLRLPRDGVSTTPNAVL